MRPRRRSIFRKIFARLFVAGMLPLLALAIAGVALLFVSYRQIAIDMEKTMLGQKRLEVERFVNAKLEEFQLLVPYTERRTPDVTLVDALLRGMLEDPELLEVSFATTVPDPTHRDIGNELIRLRQGGVDGEHRSRLGDPSYETAATGRAYIGEVLWHEEGERRTPIVEIAAPVRNRNPRQDENIVGVVIGTLRLSTLPELFRGATFGSQGSTFLLDHSGRILAHSNNAKERGADASFLAIRSDPLNALMTKESLSGEAVLTTAVPSLSTKWLLVAEWPVRDAFAPLLTFLEHIAIVAVMIFGALILLAVFQAREIVRPIRLLEEAAQRIGKGEFVLPIVVRTRDELEDLADSLKAMAQDLLRLHEVRLAAARAEALSHAMRKERELSEAQDVFLATASHQLRTPLSVINWNLELLERENLSKESKDLIGAVSEQARNLASIADDLLNATAFGAGYVAMKAKEPFDLKDAFTDAIERFQSQASAKAIRMTIEAPETPLLVSGSFGALRVMAENLIANAITYTPHGGEVSVALEKLPEQGVIRASVRDTGIGIPQAEQKHLFSPFFRASNAVTMKNVGTGLGLFIVRNIVVGHGGAIEFSSAEDQGTTFMITLPAAAHEIGDKG